MSSKLLAYTVSRSQLGPSRRTHVMITAFFKPKRRMEEGKVDSPSDYMDNDGGNNNKKLKTTTTTTTRRSRSSSSSITPSTSTSVTACITPTPKSNNTNKLSSSVAKLIHHLHHHHNHNDDDNDNCSWRKALNAHLSSPSFDRLATFVESQRYVFNKTRSLE
jgi:hypothetical protein